MIRQLILILISIALSFGGLFFILESINLADLMASIQSIHPAWLLLSFFVAVLNLWTRAVRWHYLLNRRLSLRVSSFLIGITFMFNQLPLRLGEVLRGVLAQRFGVSLITAATSILIERLLDVLVVLLLLALCLPYIPSLPMPLQQAAQGLGLVSVLAFLVLVFWAQKPELIRNRLQSLNQRFPKLQGFPLETLVARIEAGLYPLREIQSLFLVLVWTALSWFSSFLLLYILVLSLGIQTPTWLTACLGIALTSLSIAIPLSIASIGFLEAAIRLTGDLLAMPELVSTALGLIFHSIVLLSQLLMGMIGLWGLGLSWKDLSKQNSAATPY